MTSVMKLKGQTAIITGSSRGIGRAIAIALASEGCNILINYSHNEAAAYETENLIKNLDVGVKTYIAKADVSDYDQVENMVKNAIDFFGRIDILVNNAGIVRPALLKNMSREQWDKVINIDLNGTFNCVHNIINHMIENEGGRIINISSLYGQTGSFGQCNYSAAKWGVIGFTKSLALEVAKHNIMVNSVAPGAVETDMTAVLDEKTTENFINSIPMKRFAKPEEVAKTVLFLVADAEYITGEVISVNGGLK